MLPHLAASLLTLTAIAIMPRPLAATQPAAPAAREPALTAPATRRRANAPLPDQSGARPPGFAPPAPLLLRALDLDGEISAAEIDKASDSLRKADLNKDGRLSGEELPPRPPR